MQSGVQKHFVLFLFVAAALAAQRLPAIKPAKIWLDGKDPDAIPKNWNRPGHSVPHAPRGAELDESCRAHRYKAESAEEKAVEKSGWFMSGKSTSAGGAVIVGAQAFNDGMCRPSQYQEFVFVRGVFAGTLSPHLMEAREDGAFARVAAFDGKTITAEFLRYAETDARCCPSRVSQVVYEITAEQGKPLVVPTSSKTRRAE